jgi:ABC-type transporter Mla subunit MlaD
VPTEWIIGGMGSIIATLSGAVVALWRRHQADDSKRDADFAESKAIAASASKNVGDLVPAVRELTSAVNAVDKRAIERYDDLRRDIARLDEDVLLSIRRRPAR